MPDETQLDPAVPSGAAESAVEPAVEPVVAAEPAIAPEPAAPVEPAPEPAPEADSAPAPLPSEEETAAAAALRETTESVDAQEAAANAHADSIANHTVGLLHTDTVTRRAPDIAGAGPRWEQVHTSL